MSIHTSNQNAESKLPVEAKYTSTVSSSSTDKTKTPLTGDTVFLYLSGSDSDAEGTDCPSSFVKRNTASTINSAHKSLNEASAVVEHVQPVVPEIDITIVEPYLNDPVVAELWGNLLAVRQCIGELQQKS
jgi:hypothetical protein